MPSLYSTGTNTTYTVTASNVITLYQVSTSTAVITATTYSTNLVGLYGGSYSALPTNAAQLINLFDNNGNVHFYLDPVTNSSTIYANFVGTASIILGNYSFNNNTITNIVNAGIDLATNGKHYILGTNGNISLPGGGIIGDTYNQGAVNVQIQSGAGGYAGINNYDQKQYVVADDNSVFIGTNWPSGPAQEWEFKKDGSTKFPYWTFPNTTGTTGQVLSWPASGSTLAWTTQTGSSSTATTVNSITAGTGISVSTSTGSVVISNTGVLSLTAGTGTYVSTSTGNITIWTAPALSTAYDFGTILAPVSYTLDMGPII